MRKTLFVLNMILIIILVACSQSSRDKAGSSSKDIVGTWNGKTSQNYYMRVGVEIVNGSPTVTEIWYQGILIRVNSTHVIEQSNSYSTEKISENIKDGKFSYSGDDYEVSGSFKDKTLKGNLSATYTDSQFGQKIKVNVPFNLTKVDSL